MHELFRLSVITEMDVYDHNTDDYSTFNSSNYAGSLRTGTEYTNSSISLEINLYVGSVQQSGTLHVRCDAIQSGINKALSVSSSGNATISPSLWGLSSFEGGKTYNFIITY